MTISSGGEWLAGQARRREYVPAFGGEEFLDYTPPPPILIDDEVDVEPPLADGGASGERRINIWFSEPGQDAEGPLHIDEARTLSFQVGLPVSSSLVGADDAAEVKEEELPPGRPRHRMGSQDSRHRANAGGR